MWCPSLMKSSEYCNVKLYMSAKQLLSGHWHSALFTVEYNVSVRDSGLVGFPYSMCGCDETIQSCFVSEINASIQMSHHSETVSFFLFSKYPQRLNGFLKFKWQRAIISKQLGSELITLMLLQQSRTSLAPWHKSDQLRTTVLKRGPIDCYSSHFLSVLMQQTEVQAKQFHCIHCLEGLWR